MTTDLFAFRPESSPKGNPDGPLAGKTILVRPDISVTAWLTDAGSRALSGFHAVADATVVARLKAAGASFSGSARMAELGFGVNGDCMAALLSSEPPHAGLMNDTMGEARVAACSAGWYGFKPSYGLISRYGVAGLSPSMESLGILARNPADIAELLAVMAGPDEADFSMSMDTPPDFSKEALRFGAPVRIGVPREWRGDLKPSSERAFSAALATLAAFGFEIREVDFPNADLFPLVHQVVASVEASSATGKYDGVRYGYRTEHSRNWNEMYIKTRGEAFGARIKAFIFQGAHFQYRDYSAFEAACSLRRKLVEQADGLLRETNLLALPVRLVEPDPFLADTVEETFAAFRLTLGANVAGLPALQIPGLCRDGETDFGLQLIGSRTADAEVLAAGLTLSTHMKGGLAA